MLSEEKCSKGRSKVVLHQCVDDEAYDGQGNKQNDGRAVCSQGVVEADGESKRFRVSGPTSAAQKSFSALLTHAMAITIPIVALVHPYVT